MKTLFFVGALLLAGVVSAAPRTAAETHKICSAYAETARMVMKGRQDGHPMAKMMEIMGRFDEGMGPNHDLGRSFVVEAYEQPQYQTKEIQLRTIGEFENKTYLTCHKRSEQVAQLR